jgi:hypothetical protein
MLSLNSASIESTTRSLYVDDPDSGGVRLEYAWVELPTRISGRHWRGLGVCWRYTWVCGESSFTVRCSQGRKKLMRCACRSRGWGMW